MACIIFFFWGVVILGLAVVQCPRLLFCKVFFKNLKLPFPLLTEQARIVAILDKFDTLTSSISEGLTREIALRQQQYEYYRDLLFNFPKPDAKTVATA